MSNVLHAPANECICTCKLQIIIITMKIGILKFKLVHIKYGCPMYIYVLHILINFATCLSCYMYFRLLMNLVNLKF